jgi:hypothetical protein
MFYILLIIPHLLIMTGLLALAYYAKTPGSEEPYWRPDVGYDDPPPAGPQPGSGPGGLPLPDANAPRRRLRVGERLADLYPRRLRRGHVPRQPDRVPSGATTGGRPRAE